MEEQTPEQQKYRRAREIEDLRRVQYMKQLSNNATTHYNYDPLSKNYIGLVPSYFNMTPINTPASNQGMGR